MISIEITGEITAREGRIIDRLAGVRVDRIDRGHIVTIEIAEEITITGTKETVIVQTVEIESQEREA